MPRMAENRIAASFTRIDELVATCRDRDTELNVLKLGTRAARPSNSTSSPS